MFALYIYIYIYGIILHLYFYHYISCTAPRVYCVSLEVANSFLSNDELCFTIFTVARNTCSRDNIIKRRLNKAKKEREKQL